ncbi:hypothetical protein V6N12_038794 [Hibiscus sabdariffa]|uniref:Reverse transcriptase/retrotransposon-derived protein RNase H-like domain-containing protein n=1 Tax=Hibiscus sabdariffa TaxID=183260 RepID=A0ABR2CCK5_9ROSI
MSKHSREEFFKRKCCSFERRDLEKHYNAMIKLFYPLGAEQGLKQVILSSIPELLQNAIDRNFQRKDDDVESVFSIEDDLSNQSVFAIQSLEEELEEVETDWSSETIYMLQHRISTNSSTVPIPHVQAAVYLEKYGKPIPIIAFIDTGATMSIMNLNVLPKNWWEPHIRYFTSASDQTFKTTLISKPITIQFFPGCFIQTTALGSSLPGKDLIMGFDLYTKIKHLRILPTGIKYKGMHKTFVDTPRLLLTSPAEAISMIIKELKDKACSDSHDEFLSKCHHPLWKNKEFIVKLPFKKNEDINPTKASHSGMNPDHQRLAEVECKELLQQDLIEPSNSQWACEAFYVNKRSEQARGKLSPSEEAHTALLKEFQQLVLRYGIMLSERKMKIAQKEIEFLGMNLKGGQYQPGPHIAQGLLKFLKEDLSKKQTMAVRVLKEKLQQLPPLQIPSDEKRILQTDASDKYWGAILFEERDGKRPICGYKSGRFSEAEIHYHSTFKEILAVKKGINKFEFHLIGCHFLVEMDMSSFPQMLKFKQKIIPNPQLLRWAEWFSKYSFDCKHIKGKSNTLADFLIRPNSISKDHNQKIMMFRPSSSKPSKKNKSIQKSAFDIPPNLNPDFPPEVYRLVLENQFHPKARVMIFEYQLNLFQEFGGLMLKPFGLHPDYPFIHPIFFEFTEIPDELKWLLCASKIAKSSTTAEEEYGKTVRSLKRIQVEKMDPEEYGKTVSSWICWISFAPFLF